MHSTAGNLVVLRTLNATPFAPLRGCHNDGLHMSRYCLTGNFVTKSNLFWLKDKRATRQAFVDLMLGTIIPRSYETDGNVLLSLFSGHGARDRDLRDRTEADGLTEFQVPYDYRHNGYWADSELAALYGMVNPSWRVRLWNDCCHSGDSLRALGAWVGFSARKTLPSYCHSRGNLLKTFDYVQWQRESLSARSLIDLRSQLFRSTSREARGRTARMIWDLYRQDHFQTAYVHPNVIAAQGCQAQQFSLDTTIEGVAQGAFSAALWYASSRLPVSASWSLVMQTATRWLKGNGFQEQDPVLETSAPHLLDEPFFDSFN